MNDIGSYKEGYFSDSRIITVDVSEEGLRRHHVTGLIEADITEGRRRIRRERVAQGHGLSVTSWVIACIAQAMVEHEAVRTMRKGRRGLVVFEDVDVLLLIEMDDEGGRKKAASHVLRRVNELSLQEIDEEIQTARQASFEGIINPRDRGRKWIERVFLWLPRFLRRWFIWRRFRTDPFFMKRMMGTVVLSAVGMMGKGGGWGIPLSPHPLVITLGGVQKKPGVVDDRIEIREFLSITVQFDHDVIDGAPAARFVSRLRKLLQQAHGLSGEEAP